jgi:PPM family protein phosphatase
MADQALIALALVAILLLGYILVTSRSPKVATKKAAAPAPAPAPVPAVAAKAAAPAPASAVAAPSVLPKIDYEEDESVEPTKLEARGVSKPLATPLQRIVYDEDAAIDEPTHPNALILVTATGQSDKGRRRKRNEDSVLAREQDGLFVVADGMGGYNGGEIASKLAVDTIDQAFSEQKFAGPADDAVPRRASELARAIQMANEAIFQRAGTDKLLDGMGTTICAARFSPTKQRLYIGHVGDSRIYLLRDGVLKQMTSDHTMESLGVEGAGDSDPARIFSMTSCSTILLRPSEQST